MFLQGFHFRFYKRRFEEWDGGFLEDVGGATVEVTPRTRECFNQVLQVSPEKGKLKGDTGIRVVTLGPTTQQIRQPGRRKIFVRPLIMTTGS